MKYPRSSRWKNTYIEGLDLVIAINYGGRQDILNACRTRLMIIKMTGSQRSGITIESTQSAVDGRHLSLIC